MPNHDAKVVEIVRIVDPIGPASTDADLQCIAVSKETERGGVNVNEARKKNNLDVLHVHVITGGTHFQKVFRSVSFACSAQRFL